jgi:hypothetical protein
MERTIDTIAKAFHKEDARQRRNWRVGQSAEDMEAGFFLQNGNDKSFGLFLLTIRCKLLSRRVIEHAPRPASPARYRWQL